MFSMNDRAKHCAFHIISHSYHNKFELINTFQPSEIGLQVFKMDLPFISVVVFLYLQVATGALDEEGCVTQENKLCKFPFRYGGVTYWGCTKAGDSRA